MGWYVTKADAKCCCGGSSQPSNCSNCLGGVISSKLLLHVPTGTFIDPGDGLGGDGPCPDPGCGFYDGDYNFDMCQTAQTADCCGTSPATTCCCWFLCFDGPASQTGCDCELEQTTAACKQFCIISICINAPDGLHAGYWIDVSFQNNIPSDASICGDCILNGGFNAARSHWELDFSVTEGKPDCTSFNNLEIPFDYAFGAVCQATGATSVFLTSL